MNKEHYNTTNLSGAELETANNTAETQQQEILKFFKAHPRHSFTPLEVWRQLGCRYRETSVRRAITNLTAADCLEKTDVKIIEQYGGLNYKWRLRPPAVIGIQMKIEI